MVATVEPAISSQGKASVCLRPEKFNRLISLATVLRVFAIHYVTIGANLGTIRMTLDMKSRISPTGMLNAADAALVVQNLEEILGHCANIFDLSVTTDSVTYWLKRFKEPLSHSDAACAMSELDRILNSELGAVNFLYPGKVRVARLESLYPAADDDEIAGRFPHANRNIKAALRCYLCAEYTAGVFHSVRAVEKCLESLAARLAVDFEKRNWHNVISDIEKAIAALEQSPKSDARDQLIEASGRAAAQFRYVKIAWRNHVMHNRAVYDEEESWKIIEHSRGLVVESAAFLQETP
jgi:hypothetical protein